MRKTTTLASGRITGAEIITVQLVEPSNAPTVIMIRWPGQPSVTNPRRLSAVANEVMSVMAEAIAKLARLRTPSRRAPKPLFSRLCLAFFEHVVVGVSKLPVEDRSYVFVVN